MNIKVVMGHFSYYAGNQFQVKTVDRVIHTTGKELVISTSDVNVAIQTFWQYTSNTLYGKFVDFYEVPDVFQPELLTEVKDASHS